MPAINTAIVARDTFSSVAKRSNWAGKEAGVVVVFCIVFVVAVGLIGLFIHKKLAARKARKQNA
jgi:predicted permease